MERDTENPEKPTVLVLVDSTLTSGAKAGKPARDSLWPEVLGRWSWTQQSIADSRIRRDAVRINEFSTVIVNWDGANGDIVTGSDDTLLYFRDRAEDRRHALLQRGGKLVCEFQAGVGRLHQGAYSALFGEGELQVMKANLTQQNEERLWHGPEVEVWQRFRGHPLVRGLPFTLTTKYVDHGERIFNFVDGPVGEMYGYKYRSSIFWLGWFRRWKKGWVPLLIAKLPDNHPYLKGRLTPKPAVLLVKCEGNGVLIASTLWMALSRSQALVDNIIEADVTEIKKFHSRLMRNRILVDLGTPLILAALGWFLWRLYSRIAGGWLVSEVRPLFSELGTSLSLLGPLYRWAVDDFGKTWVSILLLLFYIHWIWNRPFGIGHSKWFFSAIRALRAFFGFDD